MTLKPSLAAFFAYLALSACGTSPATIEPANCGPGSLGVSRILEVGPKTGRIESLLEPREVVLTYDDGPDRSRTARVMNALAAECVTATFFLRGDQAKRYPAHVRQITGAGHTVGGHGWAHANLAELPIDAAEADIRKGVDAIERALGDQSTVVFFRFPFVATTAELSERVADMGLIEVGVSVDGEDWTPVKADVIVDAIMSGLEDRGGRGVILLHDPTGQSVASTKLLLERLKTEEYRIVALAPAKKD